MSTTWATRLAADHGHRPRLYFTIQGIPHVFQEDETDVPTVLESSARARSKTVEKIDISPSRLNIARRRIEGGTVVITLQEDDANTLASLFAPRKRRTSFITANESSSDATISVKSSTGLASPVYIDAETVTFTGTTATTLTGCTRGAFSSTAQPHFGASDQGSGVFTTPPSWKGRRLYLKSYFLNDDGTTTLALSRDEGTFSIESAPSRTKDGSWEIRCAELSDELFDKKIGGGLREIELVEQKVAGDSAQLLVITGPAEPYNQFVVGDTGTFVLCKRTDDTFTCHGLIEQVNDAFDDSILVTTLNEVRPISPSAQSGSSVSLSVKSIRHVAIMSDTAASIALMVLTSRLGDLANGASDRLPGRDRVALGEPEWRMGAGIDEGEIDVDSFEDIGGAVANWSFVVDDVTTVADFLFEFCLHTGSVAFITRAGQLAVTLLSETSNVSSMTIDDDMIAGDDEPEVFYDEGSIFPRVSLLVNYDPLSREFVGRINCYDSELTARYANLDQVLELSSKSIVVAGYPSGKVRTEFGVQSISRPTVGEAEIEGVLARIQVAGGRGDGYVSFSAHLPVMALDLGDVVTLTAAVPDLEGGTTISGKLCRVISVGPRWDDGEADVVLQLLERLHVVAPATRIASQASAVMTLVASGIENTSASPGNCYAVGQAVQVWDVSAGAKESFTLVDADATTVELSSAPTFVIQAGIDFIRPANQSLATVDESATGFTGFDYIYQIRADENDASIVEVTRWR